MSQDSEKNQSIEAGLVAENVRLRQTLQEEISQSRQQSEYLRRVIESSPDCIKTLDLDGNLLSMNDGGQVVMEIGNFAPLCGVEWSTFWQEDTRPILLAALETARNGGKGRFQGFCPTFLGTPKWWDVVVSPMLGADGRPEQLLAVSRDITELKQAEARERNIAQRLQASLQPTLPDNPPFLSLASYYRPALAEANVGGDFFDVYPVAEGCTALIVADLSGKGLAAATQVATVRSMLRLALYTGKTVSEAVATLHNALVVHRLITGFATLFVGMYDEAERSLTYVNCGQEPGLLWQKATGLVEALVPTGPVLGGYPAGDFEQRTIPLSEGDVLALFSDGLTEVGPNRKEQLEIEGVSRLLRDCCQTPLLPTAARRDPHFVVDCLIEGVDRFARGGAFDDIALLVGVVTSGQASEDDPG